PVDKTLHDEVDLIAAVNQKQIAQLCEGHLNYLKGMEYLHAEEMDLAKPLLESAVRSFALAGSPFEYWASLSLAEVAIYKSEFPVAQSVIEKIREATNLTRYRDLNTEIMLAETLMQIRKSDFISAQANLRSTDILSGDPDLHGRASLYLSEAEEA